MGLPVNGVPYVRVPTCVAGFTVFSERYGVFDCSYCGGNGACGGGCASYEGSAAFLEVVWLVGCWSGGEGLG